jgi:hypothetical protein
MAGNIVSIQSIRQHASPLTPQDKWKASLAELLGWIGGTEQSRLSAQRHNAALEKALRR